MGYCIQCNKYCVLALRNAVVCMELPYMATASQLLHLDWVFACSTEIPMAFIVPL